ncbi:MAG: polysaccharide deacetylase family protein, partial [Chloroflexota bacterium]|nr:polysaccharide deacetylase family protein [Chloroflexota bacterium]
PVSAGPGPAVAAVAGQRSLAGLAAGETTIFAKGTSGRREIALTFDAGAGRGNGPEMLDRLADYGIRASFGVTGQWASANPDLVRRMVAEGHMIFNHTWSHQSWTGRSTAADPAAATKWQPMSSADRISELERTEAAIQEISGYNVRPYFRPAYGDYDAGVLADLAAAGYPAMVMWSCESYAWKGWSAEDIVAYCTTNMADGDIILLHVGAQGADYDALPGLIEGLAAQGFAFVTVDEILQP